MSKKKHYIQRPTEPHAGQMPMPYFMGMPTHYKAPDPPVDPKQKIALQKLMVGHFIENVPEDCAKKVVYVMQGDGIYERRTNKLGTFTIKIAKVEIPGLEKNLTEGWALNVPKIPAALLGTTVSFFRSIYAKHSSEVFLQFYWDTEENEYIVHCPKQTVGGASVHYENDEMFSDEGKILVFEIHSHGQMGAFFSGTDDRDEKADRFYGVIGNINQFFPDLKLRISIGDTKVEINVEDLFDLDEEMYHAETYPKDWAERIQKAKIESVKTGKHGRKWRRRQAALLEGEDKELMDLVSQFESQDHLYSRYECFNELSDEDVEFVSDEYPAGGYYVQEGTDLWFVKDGKRYKVEDEEPESLDDPYDWRKRIF